MGVGAIGLLSYPYSPYCGAPPTASSLWLRWNLDPILLVALVAVGVGYAVLARINQRSDGARRTIFFYLGWALVCLALISPLCSLSVSLFSVRIGQHMLLETVAAPLIALGFTPSRRTSNGAIVAAAAFAAALAFWHAPRPYVATFDSTFVYWTMHVTLFGSALWFWREVIGAPPGRMATSLAATLGVSLTMALVGAVILFAPEPLYAPHIITAGAWGLTPLADEQLGAVVMWVPAGLIFVISVMLSLTAVLRREAPGFTPNAVA